MRNMDISPGMVVAVGTNENKKMGELAMGLVISPCSDKKGNYGATSLVAVFKTEKISAISLGLRELALHDTIKNRNKVQYIQKHPEIMGEGTVLATYRSNQVHMLWKDWLVEREIQKTEWGKHLRVVKERHKIICKQLRNLGIDYDLCAATNFTFNLTLDQIERLLGKGVAYHGQRSNMAHSRPN